MKDQSAVVVRLKSGFNGINFNYEAAFIFFR